MDSLSSLTILDPDEFIRSDIQEIFEDPFPPTACNFRDNWPTEVSQLKDSYVAQSDHRLEWTKDRLPYHIRINPSLSPESPSDYFKHLRFILDCFVISFGPQRAQLGRNHPNSDPELYVQNMQPVKSVIHDLALPSHLPAPIILPPFNGELSVLPLNQRFIVTQQQIDQIHDANTSMLHHLSEMRILLEYLLENGETAEWPSQSELLLFELFGVLPDSNSSKNSRNISLGLCEYKECSICFEYKWLYLRKCCNFPCCISCLQQYFQTEVGLSHIKIECPNNKCKVLVHRNEISSQLPQSAKDNFIRLITLANANKNTKTCPRCSHITTVKMRQKKKWNSSNPTRVYCPECHLLWCFSCHAPWHNNLTCKEFTKGDRLLRLWAKEFNRGQLNAQKCPKCKIFIQRTSGCDHMHCVKCKTDFCYRCGDRFRHLKFFGDHYNKFSIFGCKYRYMFDKPIQRRLIRGAVFGSKIMMAPFLGTFALFAGAVAVALGVFALPLYGGAQLLRKCEKQTTRNTSRQIPEQPYLPICNIRIR